MGGIMKKRVSKNEQKQRPPPKNAPQTEPDGPVNKAVKGAQATKKKIVRQPRAEFDANETNASRAGDQQPGNGPFVIVGVGASAGGLEAFKQLLAHLPVDSGMAFVLITHLDPKHESILPELLAKATRIPVSEVQDGAAVAPDHIYVIPCNTSMAIEGGVLRLRPRQEGRGQHRPIDSFLQSLAEDQNTRAIGVILSGTATDGTLGLEAIKAEGGITFAQAPKSARYDSMPRSAIAAGCVDFILSPEGIAEELARISSHPYVAAAVAAKPDEEETERPAGKNGFNKILALLRRTTGVDFSLYKTNTLDRRIRRRMILNKMDGLEEYARYLRENASEVENLYQDILINVTSFFRNPESFEVLKEKIFPRLIERRASDEPVRIWVLGCSTGEEAYSIAMAFTEIAGERSDHIAVQIFATDLNEKGIERARTGFYSKDITADVSPERLRRFFSEAEGGYRVSKPLRDMCVFARQNVAADPPFSRMDLISCRNLLIYLDPALQKQIMPLLHYALKPTGILWLGSSETTGAASDLFEPEDKKHRFYARKPTTKLPRLRYPTVAEARKMDRAPSAVEFEGAKATSGEKEAQREADCIILARYAPASALINEDLNVLQLRGDTAPYLEQPHGKATRNLFKLARKDLLVALRDAVDEARKDESPVRKEKLRVRYDGVTGAVNLEAIPLKHLPSHERHFLILFETAETETEGARRGGGKQKAEEQRIKQSHQELAAARDYLQSVIEEYEAANEELQSAGEEAQSSNEELQSINEELETAKEELESSNEELNTVNEELNNRNTELGRLNSDLANVLGSVRIPILILDNQLRIRRFTPAAEKLLNLIQTDVGRPIGDLKLNLDYPDLESLIAEAIDTVSVKERETRDGAGRWYSLLVRPYKTLDNKIDGAVVALLDIDALKQTERVIKAARDYAEAILRTARDPLIVLGADLRVDTANDAFYKTFKVSPDATEGRLIYDLGNHQWDIPKLRQLLEEIIPRNSFFNDYEVTREFQTIGKRTMLLNARRLDNPEGGPERILLGIDDVTERLESRAALKASELRFRRLFEAAQDGILLLDPVSRKITDANPFMAQLLGYTREEFLGKELWQIGLLEDEQAGHAAFRELQNSGHMRYDDLPLQTKDGRAIEVEFVSNLYHEDGRQVIQCNIRDISDRKRIEIEREELLRRESAARAEAEQTSRLKDEFLATVSHELRSPLNSILGWSRMLSENRLDKEKTDRAFEVIHRNAHAQNQLIGDLLDVSRIITGKLNLDVSEVELIPIINAAIDVVRPAAEAKNIRLISTLDPAAGPVSVDADRLQQVVWNLLSNAVKFTPGGGQVAVSLEREATRITLTVSDTGEGIEPEFLPFVFDRFRQFEGDTKRAHGGLGLGLAIVRHLVELHGGTVGAASPGKGRGATFTVTLPLAAPREEAGEVGRARPAVAGEISRDSVLAPDRLRGLRVLVVDDEPDALDLLSLMLTNHGAEVKTCASAAEALQTLDEWRPDALVSDIGMPREDGYDLLRKIRAREPERGGRTPAIALTAYARAEDARRALAAGYQMHIPKPVESDLLAATVASLAGQEG